MAMQVSEQAGEITVRMERTAIARSYPPDDPIWKLEVEKRERQVLADVQRDISREADRRATEKVTVRG